MASPTPSAAPSKAPSPFLQIPATIPPSSQAPSIIHLKRDLLQAITIGHPTADLVLGTRFGDFPHSSFVGRPYGSQVRAATTKPPKNGRKRKRDDNDNNNSGGKVGSGDAASGFVHVLAPTAELWTTSLPHRTQVVYTPDSSYILARLGVRPGSVLIEAGAGSGSFTHAAVRAVYRGYPDGREGEIPGKERRGGRVGKVWSFEFHRERVGKLEAEIERHGLDGLVEIVHRDVCKDGFLVERARNADGAEEGEGEGEGEEEGKEMVSPGATAVFLDLPAPWLALPHLTRRPRAPKPTPAPSADAPTPNTAAATAALSSDPTAAITVSMPLQSLLDPSSTSAPQICIQSGTTGDSVTLPAASPSLPTTPAPDDAPAIPSPLSPTETVRICCFSPCIEQVTRTTDALRRLGWTDIDMVEIAHQRLEVRRQTPRGYDDGAGPRTVSEALARLKGVSDFREARREEQLREDGGGATPVPPREKEARPRADGPEKKKKKRKLTDPDEGRLVTRMEPEIKSHTSYLTFATLPREWTEQDESAAERLVGAVSKGVTEPAPPEGPWKGKDSGDRKVSKRAMKKMAREERKRALAEGNGEGEAAAVEAGKDGSGAGAAVEETEADAEADAADEEVDMMDWAE